MGVATLALSVQFRIVIFLLLVKFLAVGSVLQCEDLPVADVFLLVVVLGCRRLFVVLGRL